MTINYNLFFNNGFTDYGILIASGLILGCTLSYFFISNYKAISSTNLESLTNLEPLTNEDIEAIINENAVNIIANENIEAIIDSDSDSDIASVYQTSLDSASESDFDEILDDLDLFFMPNVDFDVCPIEELKFFEFCSLYAREISEHSISDDEVREFISYFTDEELATNWINDYFVDIITLL